VQKGREGKKRTKGGNVLVGGGCNLALMEPEENNAAKKGEKSMIRA